MDNELKRRLDGRLVEGEITKEQYDEMLLVLKSSEGPAVKTTEVAKDPGASPDLGVGDDARGAVESEGQDGNDPPQNEKSSTGTAEANEAAVVKFNCPKCGQHIAAPAEVVGEEVQCPACAESFVAKPPETRKAPTTEPPPVPAMLADEAESAATSDTPTPDAGEEPPLPSSDGTTPQLTSQEWDEKFARYKRDQKRLRTRRKKVTAVVSTACGAAALVLGLWAIFSYLGSAEPEGEIVPLPVSNKELKAGALLHGGTLGQRMRWCPTGKFLMGSPESEAGRESNEVRNRVEISSGFYMWETEVTQNQWEAVMGRMQDDQVDVMLSDTRTLDFGEKIGVKTMASYYLDKLGAKESDLKNFAGGKDYPIYFVSWSDAQQFCRKLTEMERESGNIPEDWEYRLPTEAEWEYACRAGNDEATYGGELTVKTNFHAPELDGIAWYGGNSSVGYPAGSGWGSAADKDKQYPGGTAGPRAVGGMLANRWGLHDMIGNLNEWCEDGYVPDETESSQLNSAGDSGSEQKVIRGSSWLNPVQTCRAAFRGGSDPLLRTNSLGFRPVLSVVGREMSVAGVPTTPLVPPGRGRSAIMLASATMEQPFENSLGMRFAPAGSDTLLFSVHETRVRDFRAFVEATGHDATGGMYSLGEVGIEQRGDSWENPGFLQNEDHPVVGVSWEDAQEFCWWLTYKERKAGRISADLVYRLPTDVEWQRALAPRGAYLWGNALPVPENVGNYAGEEASATIFTGPLPILSGYRDAHTHTSPVGSFAPNAHGLYDMGGNVEEWCADWFSDDMNDEDVREMLAETGLSSDGIPCRVLRDGSWGLSLFFSSSYRNYASPNYRSQLCGFRCVLALETTDTANDDSPVSGTPLVEPPVSDPPKAPSVVND